MRLSLLEGENNQYTDDQGFNKVSMNRVCCYIVRLNFQPAAGVWRLEIIDARVTLRHCEID